MFQDVQCDSRGRKGEIFGRKEIINKEYSPLSYTWVTAEGLIPEGFANDIYLIPRCRNSKRGSS